MANPRQDDKSTHSMEDAARHATQSAGEQVKSASEQMNRIGQTTAEQTTRIGQAAAETGEKVARVGADLIKQNTEALQEAMRFGLNVTTTVMGRSTDQLGRTLGLSGDGVQQATERSTRNAQTILYSTAAATNAMSGMSREYFEMVRHQIENSLNRMNEFWGCRTPQDLVAVQSELLRDTVGTVLESSRRIADLSIRLADDATKRMSQDMQRAA
jgi:phasin family protein